MAVRQRTGRRAAPARRGASGRVRQVAWAPDWAVYANLPPDRLDGLRDWLLFGLPGRPPAAAVAPPRTPARSLDWSGAFQDRSSRAARGDAEQGEARRGAAPCRA